VRVQPFSAWLEKSELTALFFLHGMALGIWFVPLSRVLDAHGLQGIKPFAFATSALAAFVSPLIFGAMADRHASPVKVLRGLAVATALAMALASTAIKLRWNPWLVLGLIQLHALCCSFTLVFITAQIYLDERVDPAWRARGQALMSLMGSGVGQLIGYLGAGWWFLACGSPAGMRWPLFWAGVSAGCGAVLLYFLIAYHGIGAGLAPARKVESGVGARFADGVE